MKKVAKSLFSFAALLLSPWALGDGAPSPYDQNHSGAFAAGTLSFGQSRAAGGSSPGTSWLAGGELGYIAAQESWNRLEMGAEFGVGAASFKPNGADSTVDLDIDFYVLAKFGYAYAIADNVFGVLRVGAGPVAATYPAASIAGSDSSESLTGFMGLIGYDVVVPASEKLEFVAGVETRMASFSGDDVDSFQLNTPGLNLAVRFKL